jgi:hypothetical protein
MKKFLSFFVFLFFLHQISFAGIDFGILSPTAPVKDILNGASNDISSLINQATNSGDYVLEKNLEQANLMLNNLRTALSDDLDTKIHDLGKLEKKSITDFYSATNALIDHTSEKYLKAEEFTAMDVSELMNKIPFIKSHPYLASLSGIGQTYKSIGFYSVSCLGTVFKPENSVRIIVDGKQLPAANITPNINQMSFDIPLGMLNKYFGAVQLNRVPFKIIVTSEKPKVWYNPSTWFSSEMVTLLNFSGRLLLIPKYPVTSYHLSESISVDHWSTETYDSPRGYLLLNKASKCGQWVSGMVKATVPAGGLMIKGSVRPWWAPAHAWVFTSPNYIYNDAENSVEASCNSQLCDQDIKFYIQCKYRMPVSEEKSIDGYFQSSNKNVTGSLNYGVYQYPLTHGRSIYILEVTFFNGETVTVTADEPEANGVKTYEEKVGSHFTHLIVRIFPT